MASFEFVAITLTGLGLAASIVYYASILNNANKTRELQLKAQELTLRNQELQLETRQAQLFMSIYQNHVSKENIADWIELINHWEWIDINDFNEKYRGPGNLEKQSKYGSYMNRLEGLGIMARRGLIDVNFIYDFMYGSIITLWEKYLPIIEVSRQRVPYLYKDLEYLYDEMIRIRDERANQNIKPH